MAYDWKTKSPHTPTKVIRALNPITFEADGEEMVVPDWDEIDRLCAIAQGLIKVCCCGKNSVCAREDNQ